MDTMNTVFSDVTPYSLVERQHGVIYRKTKIRIFGVVKIFKFCITLVFVNLWE
jgi:hypothetical protein